MEFNNCFDKLRFSPKLRAYFGKHKIFEIFRDITKMLKEYNPDEIYLPMDIIEQLDSAEDDNPEIITNIIDYGVDDLETFLETYSKTFNCPIVYYTKKRTENDTCILMGKLRKFLKTNGLNGKHLITFNFPSDRNELLNCNAAGFSPNNVIKIIPKSLNESSTIPYGNNELLEVEADYEDRIMSFKITNDVEEDCYRFNNAINQFRHISKPDPTLSVYLQRIIIFGHIGSGRKTQGRLLAERWHLIFLDFRLIVLNFAKSNKDFDNLLSKIKDIRQLDPKLIASILSIRISKKDCLDNGWVLVGYPQHVNYIEIMEKLFYIIPNKIVFIHCRQYLCLDRLRTRINKNILKDNIQHSDGDDKYAKLGFLSLYRPCYAINFIAEEITRFRRSRSNMLEYYRIEKRDILHINGERSIHTVKTEFWGRIEKLNL